METTSNVPQDALQQGEDDLRKAIAEEEKLGMLYVQDTGDDDDDDVSYWLNEIILV